MSKIGGKLKEPSEGFSKKIGLFVGNVITVNPTLKEMVDILEFPEKEDAVEPVYTGESKDGNPYVRIDFWIKDIKSDFKHKTTFFIEDKVRMNRDETKVQYINNVGVCSWAEDESDLAKWFTERSYRKAKSGEEDLYNFMRTWLSKIDFFNKEIPAELELNFKKLIKGNLSEIKNEINGDWCVPFTSLATVVTKEINGEVKEFQNIYNKAFLHEYSLKHFHLMDYDNDMVIENIEAKPFKERKNYERFVSNIKGDFGCKDHYILKDLTDYDPSKNIVSSDTTIEDEATY